MSALRNLARSSLVGLWGREPRPRMILRGLARGYRICVSPAEHLAYLVGTAEPHLQRAIRKYVAPGDTVYDVGANIGYVSLSLAKRVGTQGQVIAFEPVPLNAESLHKNIILNHLHNVRLLNVAASDRQGDAIIRIGTSFSTASLVWHKKDPAATELVVPTVVIDELVQQGDLPYPTFVKIDVEGAEGLVLQGMRRTLAAAKPVLFVECSEAGRETSWQLLRELGYRCQSAITLNWVNAFCEYCHSDFLWHPL